MKLIDSVVLECGTDTCSGELILEDAEGAWNTLSFSYDRRTETLAPEVELDDEDRSDLLEEIHERLYHRRERVRQMETEPIKMCHERYGRTCN